MQTITTFDNTAEGWERSLYAFLAEKERRSGSLRTVVGYSRMLQHFFGTVGKPPDRVTGAEVFAWGYGVGLSGKQPSSVTIGARLACLSSFYRFLIRMDIVSSNPCDALERPRVQVAPPRGLGADDIRKLLAVMPETPVGLRDRAIILTLTLTGRRRAEVLNMVVGDLANEDGKVWYHYRGKGNKQGKRELPEPAYVAITAALSAFGRNIATMPPEASLWPSSANDRGVTSGTFYGNLRRYLKTAGLPLAGVHIFRHSAAKLRRDAGESIENVSRFLDLAGGTANVFSATFISEYSVALLEGAMFRFDSRSTCDDAGVGSAAAALPYVAVAPPYATESTGAISVKQALNGAAQATEPPDSWTGCNGSPPLAPVVLALVNVKSEAPPVTLLLNSDVATRIESPAMPFVTSVGNVNVDFSVPLASKN
jgi:site-specific recombinase XerD